MLASKPARSDLADRRATISVTCALMMLPFMALMGLVVDEGFWTIASTRLQIAADAAAMADSFTLSSAAFQQQSPSAQMTTLQNIAYFEANAAATKLIGTMQAPPTVNYDTTGYSRVTVTLKTQAPSFFASAVNVPPPLLTASATASIPLTAPCALTLGSSGTGIQVDNQGTIAATGCGLFSDSAANPSIYLNSGTLSGSSIGAVGTVSMSDSGSNSMSPSTPQPNQHAVSDPDSGKTAPTAGTCNATNNYTSNGTYNLTPGTWCGTTTFGGNGSTDTFASGVYIINNGDLTFTNANVTFATGVTFVLTGTSPGSFNWVNNSSSTSISAPTSGTTAGIAFWLACNSNGNQKITISSGGTLTVTGSIYAPCAAMNISNNTAVVPPSGGQLSVITSSIYVTGSGSLRPSSGSNSNASSHTAALTN